ncbi:MAG: biotin transporter BioY [Pseudomonadota bacterium]
MTLAKALAPSQSLPVKVAMVVLGSAFIALAAQVSVPMIPVPMTLQTLAILIVGFGFGARMGAATVIAYLAEGAMGLPVFAGGMNGIAFAGPTAGFLIGFVGLAWLAGSAADRGVTGVLPTALVALLASALLYVPGAAWAMLADTILGLDASKWGADDLSMIWTWYVAPFLLGDAVKAVIAALAVTGGWAAVKGRKV